MRITEEEYSILVHMCTGGKYIDCAFGPGYVELRDTENAQWAKEFIEKHRSAQSTLCSRPIADNIVNDLFENGFGDKAKILKLVDSDGKDLGGVNRASVRDTILKRLPNWEGNG